MTAHPARWLVLPGLACPPESFDAVRDLLRARGADLVLDVRDAPLATDVDRVLDGGTYDGVIGHSLGGLLAVEIALHHPDRVDRVVLLDPTPPREQGPPAAIRAVLHGAVPALVRSADALRLLAAADRLLTRRWHRHGTAIDPRSFRDPGTWTQLWAELEAGWDRARRVDADLVTRSLAHRPDLLVPVPVTSAARRSQQRLAARLGATLHPVVGSGHLVMCDRPDAVVDALLVGPPRTTGGTGG